MPQTNIVYFRCTKAGLGMAALAERLKARGVRIGPTGPDTARAVTHLDVDDEDIGRAIAALREALAE
jgi:threonine aldolase